MKRLKYLGFGLVSIALLAFAPNKLENNSDLEIGGTSEAFSYEVYDFGNNGKPLEEYKGEKGLLVVFTSNTCPFVVAWEDRYNELQEVASKNGISMVLINSNEAYRAEEDSPVNMRMHAADLNYSMPYVIDKDHRIADKFGAKTTPHVYLFDSSLRLAYKGAIDDNYKDKGAVTETYAQDAIVALGAGKEIATKETKALGCSIKRVKK